MFRLLFSCRVLLLLLQSLLLRCIRVASCDSCCNYGMLFLVVVGGGVVGSSIQLTTHCRLLLSWYLPVLHHVAIVSVTLSFNSIFLVYIRISQSSFANIVRSVASKVYNWGVHKNVLSVLRAKLIQFRYISCWLYKCTT